MNSERLLLVVGGVGIRRAVESKTGPRGQRELATFVALGVASAWFLRGVG